MKTFFLFDWYKKEIENGSFRKAPKIPRRCRKNGKFLVIFQNNLFQVDRSCLRFRRVKTKNSREHLSAFFLSFSNGKVQELKNVYLTQVLVWGQKKSLLLLFRCYWENRGRRAEKKPKKLSSESLSNVLLCRYFRCK